MGIKILAKNKEKDAVYQAIMSMSLIVFIWSLLPILFSYESAGVIILLIGISFTLMMFDSSLTVFQRRDIVFKYLLCGFLSLYLWLIGKKELHSFIKYHANSIIIWYPVAFAYYLAYKKHEKNVLRIIIHIMLVAVICTGVTTFIGLKKYPMASRWLAGGHAAGMLALLRSQNIGGYSYIYMISLMFPVLLGTVFVPQKNARTTKVLSVVCTIIIPPVVLYSQYMIALYMVLYSMTVLLMAHFISFVIKVKKKKVLKKTVVFCIMPIIALLFIYFRAPINDGIGRFAHSLGLKSLTERAATIVEKDDRFIDKEGTWLEDVSYEGGDPLVFRIKPYLKVINSITHSPLFGGLTDSRVKLSQHSDIIDGLFGGGIFGAIFFVFALFHIVSGFIKQLQIPARLQGNVLLMGCLLLGLGILNTVFLSREIILMVTLFPVALSLVFGEGKTD